MEEIKNLIRKKSKEIQVTKDNNSYWKGVIVGLTKAVNIIQESEKNKPKYKPTLKTIEAEKWVDRYILENGYSPTYQELADGIKTGKTAAFYRCRTFKEKMNQHIRPINN